MEIFDQFEFSIVLASLSIITGKRLWVRAGIAFAVVGFLFALIAGVQGLQAQMFQLPVPGL